MTADELFARAIDPKQYDSPGLDWPQAGVLSSPSIQLFHRYLRRELGDLRGQEVIDIGCGTGHLFALLEELGARRVVGLEPSARNAAFARREYPRVQLIAGALQDVALPRAFDLAVAVMSFEHQPDLLAAYRRVSGLLRPRGTFVLVAGDKSFHLAPRFDLRLEAHELADGSAVVSTGYPFGTIHDIVRPLLHYKSAARATGFRVRREVELVPCHELIEADARWAEFERRPFAHLLVMERSAE